MSRFGLQCVFSVSHTRIRAWTFLFFACLFPFTIIAESPSQRLVPRVKGYLGSPYGYWEYLPQHYSESSAFSVVVYLHGIKEIGSGETETELRRVLLGGPPSMIARVEKNFPFVLICPQSPGLEDGFAAEKLSSLIDMITTNYKVDVSRIYFTGISYGAYATWRIAEHSPEKVAGIIPISSCGNVTKPEALKNVAIWAFTNSGDYAIPGCMYDVISKIRTSGGTPLLKIYNDKGHNAWNATYQDENMWTWLLAQKKLKDNEACAPVFVRVNDQTATIGYPYTIELRASDPDNNCVEFIVDEKSLPSGVMFSEIHNGYAKFSVTSQSVGSYPITIAVRDSSGYVVEQQFKLAVVRSPLFLPIVLLLILHTIVIAWILFRQYWLQMISATTRKARHVIDVMIN